MIELKLCPFCGSKEIHSYVHTDHTQFIGNWSNWKVCCGLCSAQIYRGTQEEAEKAWNRRAE